LEGGEIVKSIIPVILAACLLALAQEKPEARLPEGPGKKEVLKICTKCHDLDGFIGSRNSRARWETVVDEMVSRGAEGSDAEIELIVEYLAKNMGRLNLNSAAADALAEGLGISKELGAAMVAYRQKNGPFRQWTDLAKVPGIDMKKLEDKKGLVEF
jgi:competence protein ComEA